MSNILNTVTANGSTISLEEYQKQQSAKRETSSALDKDAFLSLMVKQMEYQDPLDPQDNSEYVAQLAQFSALEQMTNVATAMEKVGALADNMNTTLLVGQLNNMIGQQIQWLEGTVSVDAGGNSTAQDVAREGYVTGVSISDGSPSIIATVDGKNFSKVAISDIVRIGQGNS